MYVLFKCGVFNNVYCNQLNFLCEWKQWTAACACEREHICLVIHAQCFISTDFHAIPTVFSFSIPHLFSTLTKFNNFIKLTFFLSSMMKVYFTNTNTDVKGFVAWGIYNRLLLVCFWLQVSCCCSTIKLCQNGDDGKKARRGLYSNCKY